MVSQGLRRGARVQGDEDIRRESQQTIVVGHFEGAQDSSLQKVDNHSLDPHRVQSIVRDKQYSVLHGVDFDHGEGQCYRARASGDNSDGRWCCCVVFIDIPAGQIREEISHDRFLQRDPPVLQYLDTRVPFAGFRFRFGKSGRIGDHRNDIILHIGVHGHHSRPIDDDG